MADKFKLMQHQELALGVMEPLSSLGVFYDMGTGKTAIALMYLYEKLQRKSTMQALIVCPANLVDKWWEDVDGMINFEGVTARGLSALKKALTIRSFQKLYKTGKKNVVRKGKTYVQKVHPLRPDVDRHWDVMCVDESHCIGAHDSVQSKAAWEVAKLSDERFIFTGTPVHGGGGKSDYSKLYGQFRVLHPHNWMTWTEFIRRYVRRMNPRFHTIEEYDVPACRKLMEQNAIVCRLEDCVELPGYTDIEVKCPLVEKKVYKDIKEMDVEKYGIDLTTGGSPWIKLLQTCSGSLKRANDTLMLKTSKDDQIETLLSGTDEKMVVFCNFRASIDRVVAISKKVGRSVVTVDGRSKGEAEWKKFQNGAVNTIVCQYMSGGAGLNLYAANFMVFYEPTPSAKDYSQARRRIYRKGQTRKCLYYILTTPNTMEARAWNAVRQGMDVTEKMMEEWANEE